MMTRAFLFLPSFDITLPKNVGTQLACKFNLANYLSNDGLSGYFKDAKCAFSMIRNREKLCGLLSTSLKMFTDKSTITTTYIL